MSRKVIKTGSVTFAVKGKELLVSNGYKSFIARDPKPEKGEGCGYVIYVNNYDDRCLAVLKNGGIKIRGVSDAGAGL